MSGKELNRIKYVRSDTSNVLKTIYSVLEKGITQKKAADILDLSDRRIRRIVIGCI